MTGKTDQSSMMAPRFREVATFMRTPYVEDFSTTDIGLVGVPFDGAVTNRPGTRHGPRQVRDMSSMMRTTHHVSKINPYDNCRIGDVGDLPLTNMYDLPTVNDQITSFYQQLVEKSVFPISIGGDHSITYPILRAVAGKGPVDPKRTIQIGIRGAQNSPEGWNYSGDSGMRVIFIEEFRELGIEGTLKEIENVVGAGECYLSFDIDSIDPVYAPGTGTPEIGGLTPFEGQQLIRGLKKTQLVGADVVEVSPPFDQSGNTALVAATLVFEMLCIIAEQISNR